MATDTRASLDKARRLRGQVACIDGAFVALHVMQQQPPEPEECILEDMAVMALQSRHQQSLALRNLDSDSLRNLDSIIEAVDVRCVMLCIETGEVVSNSESWHSRMEYLFLFTSTRHFHVIGTNQ